MIAEKSSKTIDVQINKDVLVVGAGKAGLTAAAQIAAQGYKAVVIGNKTACACGAGCSKEMQDAGLVEIQDGTSLVDIAGVAGDFRVTLGKGEETCEVTFGAVVVAPQYTGVPLNSAYGLALNDKVISQTQLEALLADDAGKEKLVNGSGSTVAFLSGFGQEGDPTATGRVLASALEIQKLENCRSYIYAGNVKVGAKGMERLFTQGRNEGVVCFKPKTMPTIEQDKENVKIVITDPVVRADVELEPDYVVVEEGVVVGPDNLGIAQTLGIDADVDGFLPSNNVHRFPVKSNREGIYVAQNDVDAANVALQVKALIGDGVRTLTEDIAVVDDTKCVICLTCYRCCPHGAIFWQDGAAVISPAACQGCGICASECPMDAIQLGEFTDADLKSGVKEAVASAADATPSIVAFCCKNSALEAGEAAAQFGHEMPAGFRMVKVPCAGKVDVDFIMNALVEGADGVMVAACHEGNCKAERGNIYAGWRVEEIRQRLENMGLNKDRVVFTTIASNMAREFACKVNEFAEKL
ncbi:4Fe-4S binding domain-containing protein [Desulfocicer vacuolatum DSM 3385]|uniref:4Fe-4S binding domain-containing protein n=1 Tax=Desulfocicer vacuolatum DSM 3385 TaxID=1121400 RepID=A0A1W1YLU9_9BACT|nr:hydrogenase iron-sulfur subunit [Desulfocicer vacuolatum]SMC37175.1 4Fe-4S binding domain-containing protein [Desulfocicer vacuolatum DSM 3385]